MARVTTAVPALQGAATTTSEPNTSALDAAIAARRRPAHDPASYPRGLPSLSWRADLKTARVGLTGSRLSRMAPQLQRELADLEKWMQSSVQLDRHFGALQVGGACGKSRREQQPMFKVAVAASLIAFFAGPEPLVCVVGFVLPAGAVRLFCRAV